MTFALAALVFSSLSIPAGERDPDPLDVRGYLDEVHDGVSVLTGSVAGQMLVASLFANFLLSAALAVLPAFAAEVGGPDAYGLLLAAMSVGGLVGTLVATGVDHLPLGRTNVLGFGLAGACWLGAVAAPETLLTVVLFATANVPVGVYNVSIQATLQTGVPDDLLGRVVSTTSSASNVVGPAGLLAGGLVGERLGARTTMVLGGVGVLLTAAYWALVPKLRRFGPPTAVTSGEFGSQ